MNMSEIILRMKLGKKVISSKQEIGGGNYVKVPLMIKNNTLHTLIFSFSDINKKEIPIYDFSDIEVMKLNE